MAIEAQPAPPPGPSADARGLGWTPAWPLRCSSRRLAGSCDRAAVDAPSIARRRSCATASRRRPAGVGLRSFRFEPRVAAAFPTVGRLGRARRPAQPSDTVIRAVLPRRSALRLRQAAGAAGPRPRSWPPTSTSPSSSPRSTTTSTCAGSSATSPSPGRAAPSRSSCLNKADLADDVEADSWPARRPSRRGVPRVVVSARHRRRARRASRAHLGPAATAAFLGSSGVGKSTLVNALLGEDAAGDREVRGPMPAAGTPPPTASCSCCPAAACSSTRPASAR